MIEIQELFFTRPFLMLYTGGLIGIAGLIMVIIKSPRTNERITPLVPSLINKSPRTNERITPLVRSLINFLTSPFEYNTYEVFRFIFLSVIAATPIVALALTDVQIAPVSPIGLVIKSDGGNTTAIDENQWVVNIGGIASNNYSSGVQIPINVVIFGIAGAYLRFLYYTSTREGRDRATTEPFYESLKDLAILFLAPLLAMALWLVLFQGGTTSPFTLAAISFTVGLITKEVVDALINFISSRIAPQESKKIH